MHAAITGDVDTESAQQALGRLAPCTPSLAGEYERLRAVSWKPASLFGGLASNARRWRSKRAMLEQLCARHDVVLLQETRGKEADMLTLPSGFVWMGSFFRASDLDATSRAGGVVLGIRLIVPGARAACMVEVSRGRCFATRIHHGSGSLCLINVHLDPSMSPSGKHSFLRSFRNYVDSGDPTPTFAGGDWNFLATDEVRLDVERGERRDGTRIATAFDAMCVDFTECAQEQHTFSRVFDDGANAVYSRIDRWYCNLDLQAMGRVVISVSVIGSLLSANRASDHLPVSVVWVPRSRRARRRPIAKETVTHEVSLSILAGMTDDLDCTRNLARRYDALVKCAHRAARIAQKSVVQHAPDDPRLLAEAALRMYVALRDGVGSVVQDLVAAVPRLMRCRCDETGTWDPKALLRMHRARLEESICHDMAVLERAKVPERHKASARGQLRRQHVAVRSVRRRVAMDSLYDDDGGEALTIVEAAGAALSAYWRPVFNWGECDLEVVQTFLDFVQPAGGRFQGICEGSS